MCPHFIEHFTNNQGSNVYPSAGNDAIVQPMELSNPVTLLSSLNTVLNVYGFVSFCICVKCRRSQVSYDYCDP